jgi:spermidine synthase
MLGSTSPLLQAWMARVGAVTYRLFALSNLASLLALVAYPVVIEPYVALRMQRLIWSFGVLLFAVLSGVVAWKARSWSGAEVSVVAEDDAAVSSWRTRLMWLLLPMVGAMQLSAVTEHLTVNVAAIPLLWILPLAVYLATFVVAFQAGWSLPRTALRGLLAVMLVSLGQFAAHPEMALPIGLGIGMFLLELLVACLFCHGALYGLRPRRTNEVTAYYLTIAAGGAAGAFLVGIVAPLVFHADYDLSITLALTGVLVLVACWGDGLQQRMLWGAVAVLLVVYFSPLRSAYQQRAMYSTRNFYGGLRVTKSKADDGSEMRTLWHGTVTHGSQIFSSELQRLPTTYYARDSGIGLALRSCCGDRPRRLGVVGLGVGTLAAYGRPGDSMRFYEINPAVRPIAQDYFTYLRDSGAAVTFAEGDARASLAAEPAQGFDVLAIDAFSGDAIPLHLLTVEAMEVYRRHLAPGGVLAFHVSNRYVDLEPEIAALALRSGMQARGFTNKDDERVNELAASWLLLTVNGELLRSPELAAKGHELPRRAAVKPWTDDYSSLLPLIRW